MKSKINIRGLLFFLALVLLWEVAGRFEIVNPPTFLPPFSAVLFAFGKLVFGADLLYDVWLTLQRSLTGLLLAGLVALPAGLVMGHKQSLYDTFAPTVELLRPIPPAAIIPVAILFLGIHTEMKIAVIVFGCLWPILINTIDGVRGIDPVLLDTGRTLGLKSGRFFVEIVLKGASPYIVSGFRISLAISLILAVVTEMIAGNDGLGFFIMLSERSFKIDEMYAGLLAAGIMGLLINKGFLLFTDKFILKWYRGYTAKV